MIKQENKLAENPNNIIAKGLLERYTYEYAELTQMILKADQEECKHYI